MEQRTTQDGQCLVAFGLTFHVLKFHAHALVIFPVFQHEAVANVRKTKSLYITRQQEYEKAKETAQKAESESLSQSSAGQANKLEKKKKLVEDVLRKVSH